MNSQNGFTLVELIVVFTLMAIISAIVYPRFHQLRNKAVEAQEDAVVAAIKQRLVIYAGEQFLNNHSKSYPAGTDVAADPTILLTKVPKKWTVEATGSDAVFIFNEGEFDYTYSCDGGSTYSLTRSS